MAQLARERIVVGIGEAPSDEAALHWVAARATRRPVAVTLVMTADLRFADYEAVCAELEVAERVITERSPGTPTRGVFVDGPADSPLVKAAEEADLLVLAAHPATVATRPPVPLGSAADASRVTVLVPSAWSEATGPVIVGIDGDDTTAAALAVAEREAAAVGASVQTLERESTAAPVPLPVLVDDALAAEPADGVLAAATAGGPIDVADAFATEGAADFVAALVGDGASTESAPTDAPIPVDRAVRPTLVVVGAGHRALVTGTLTSPDGDELLTDHTPLAIVR
ncbi:hypothetical protein CLV46_0386 [Diaminobutyricimonas aerilata]|uniref:Universal stress protein family protein n=1 Tax=Diaminobutyricimonas aerilata TaxID=1162967 RepID=A0A2M9CG52_9MICO|nr:universal stress protein [Diaminobutyricimonas aerilata]PJJ70857.1 hypothetical protein CLV46_0386 [Diaminobutyricimonas aerilata]